jgi:acetyl-CoA acetyltransferase
VCDEAVIVAITPSLGSGVEPAARTLGALERWSAVPPEVIDKVIWNGRDRRDGRRLNLARRAASSAGWSPRIVAVTLSLPLDRSPAIWRSAVADLRCGRSTMLAVGNVSLPTTADVPLSRRQASAVAVLLTTWNRAWFLGLEPIAWLDESSRAVAAEVAAVP